MTDPQLFICIVSVLFIFWLFSLIKLALKQVRRWWRRRFSLYNRILITEFSLCTFPFLTLHCFIEYDQPFTYPWIGTLFSIFFTIFGIVFIMDVLPHYDDPNHFRVLLSYFDFGSNIDIRRRGIRFIIFVNILGILISKGFVLFINYINISL